MRMNNMTLKETKLISENKKTHHNIMQNAPFRDRLS